jgi:hypothetical protein
MLIIDLRNVALCLSYRGPRDAPLDTATLRGALELYDGSDCISIVWDATKAVRIPGNVPQLPSTLPSITAKPSSDRGRFSSLSKTIIRNTSFQAPIPPFLS